MPGFKDHFSGTAANYARYRPAYPVELFRWLAAIAPAHDRAWDCGTGSGQAACELAEYFTSVIATDPSTQQLLHARSHPHVTYAAMTAEHAALATDTVRLVTVAQALHWFEPPGFFREVRRVVAPGGIIAVWSYGLLTIDPGMDGVIGDFYRNRVGAHWPPERAIVDAGMAGIDFPFDEIVAPPFAMEADWTLDQFAGYVGTWSAVNRYVATEGTNPVPEFIRALRPAWGSSTEQRRIRWPLSMRVGTVTLSEEAN